MEGRLLIADGDAELRDLYTRFFAHRGFDVETAADGVECLARLHEFRPCVVVVDWQIRWGGGDGVISCLREGYPITAGGIIVLAGEVTPEERELLDGASAITAWLRKPFHLSHLLQAIGEVRCQPSGASASEAVL